MSVLGIGTDLVAVERIAIILDRHGERFLNRCFRNPDLSSLAGRWAAKEAFLKALGADVRKIPYRDIEVRIPQHGPSELVLHGRALAALATAGGKRVHLTISHERDFALASVIIEV